MWEISPKASFILGRGLPASPLTFRRSFTLCTERGSIVRFLHRLKYSSLHLDHRVLYVQLLQAHTPLSFRCVSSPHHSDKLLSLFPEQDTFALVIHWSASCSVLTTTKKNMSHFWNNLSSLNLRFVTLVLILNVLRKGGMVTAHAFPSHSTYINVFDPSRISSLQKKISNKKKRCIPQNISRSQLV